jgi:Uma2 family endonuclease
MSAIPNTLMTFEEFERLMSDVGKDELFDGEWIHLPPAFRRHMRIVRRIYDALKAAVADAHSSLLGEVCIETGYRIGRNSWLQPDVSVEHFNQPGATYPEGAPALAVEVVSESNSGPYLNRKVKAYLDHGSREVWLVYPLTRSIWVYLPGAGREFTGVLQSDLIPGLRLDLERIFDANPVG